MFDIAKHTVTIIIIVAKHTVTIIIIVAKHTVTIIIINPNRINIC